MDELGDSDCAMDCNGGVLLKKLRNASAVGRDALGPRDAVRERRMRMRMLWG